MLTLQYKESYCAYNMTLNILTQTTANKGPITPMQNITTSFILHQPI